MQSIFAQIVQHFVATLLLTSAVFLILVRLLQGRSTAATWGGAVRTLWALITGPLHYVRDTLDRFVTTRRSGVPDQRGDPQMLIKRLLLGVGLIVVTIALADVSSGMVRGWFAMVPPSEVVANYKAAVREKAALDSVLPLLRGQQYRLDSIWRIDSARWVAAYEDTLKSRAAVSATKRSDLLNQVAAKPEVARQRYTQLLTDLNNTPTGYISQRAAQFREDVRVTFASIQGANPTVLAQWGIAPRDTLIFQQFLDAWIDGRSAEEELQRWPPSTVRSRLQPQVAIVQDSLDRSTARNQTLTNELPDLRALTAWHPSLFFLTLATALASAFVLLWIAGIGLEFVGLLFALIEAALRYFGKSNEPPGVAAPAHAYRSGPAPVGGKPADTKA